MFFGRCQGKADAKHRVKIPGVILRQLQKSSAHQALQITRGYDECLYLFSKEGWEDRTRRMEKLPPGDETARRFEREFFSSAFEVEPDSLGRFVIPDELRDILAGATDLMFAGVRDRVEIWAEERWRAECSIGVAEFKKAANQVLT